MKWGKSKRFLWGLAGMLIISMGMVRMDSKWMAQARHVWEARSADVILIDAGHGGFDGGAVSKSGVAEKDINLAIALGIRDLAEADGWRVVMTRTDDRALDQGDEARKGIRTRKTEDLMNRRKLIDETDPMLAVSIHLNSFREDPSVRGAQTFFPSGAGHEKIRTESQKLAEMIQKELVEGLKDGTNRDALGKKDVLLLKDPKVPTALVECGFLSNEEEVKLLQDPQYQRKLSEFIYNGILAFSGKNTNENLFVLDSRTP